MGEKTARARRPDVCCTIMSSICDEEAAFMKISTTCFPKQDLHNGTRLLTEVFWQKNPHTSSAFQHLSEQGRCFLLILIIELLHISRLYQLSLATSTSIFNANKNTSDLGLTDKLLLEFCSLSTSTELLKLYAKALF